MRGCSSCMVLFRCSPQSGHLCAVSTLIRQSQRMPSDANPFWFTWTAATSCGSFGGSRRPPGDGHRPPLQESLRGDGYGKTPSHGVRRLPVWYPGQLVVRVAEGHTKPPENGRCYRVAAPVRAWMTTASRRRLREDTVARSATATSLVARTTRCPGGRRPHEAAGK
jgi:hypothetical protein